MAMSHGSTAHHDVYGLERPRLRGLVHAWSIAPMVLAGLVLVAYSPTLEQRLSVAVYTVAIGGMLAASASYHRLRVSEKARRVLRRLDHSMIGVAVAGTYTPVVVIVLDGAAATAMLGALWAGALGAMLVSVFWSHAPRALRAGIYLLLGWGGAVLTPWLWQRGGVLVFSLVILGAALYSAGAIVYARRRPNPWPTVYGFHEVFHTLVVLAVVAHFAAIVALIART